MYKKVIQSIVDFEKSTINAYPVREPHSTIQRVEFQNFFEKRFLSFCSSLETNFTLRPEQLIDFLNKLNKVSTANTDALIKEYIKKISCILTVECIIIDITHDYILLKNKDFGHAFDKDDGWAIIKTFLFCLNYNNNLPNPAKLNHGTFCKITFELTSPIHYDPYSYKEHPFNRPAVSDLARRNGAIIYSSPTGQIYENEASYICYFGGSLLSFGNTANNQSSILGGFLRKFF